LQGTHSFSNNDIRKLHRSMRPKPGKAPRHCNGSIAAKQKLGIGSTRLFTAP
jgi:hypothetical protein